MQMAILIIDWQDDSCVLVLSLSFHEGIVLKCDQLQDLQEGNGIPRVRTSLMHKESWDTEPNQTLQAASD